MQLAQHIAFHCIFLHFVCPQEIPTEKKEKILDTDFNSRNAEQLEDIGGRTNYPRRKSLPSPKRDLFSGGHIERLRCGGTYSVAEEGYYLFNLVPHEQPCSYQFLGSKNEKCKTAILCEKITLAPPTKDSGCDHEWLALSDGQQGLMSGCGSFTFAGSPRVARDNLTDIYLYLKGSSPSRCIAFCHEELGSGRADVKKTKRISRDKKYKGYKMETECKCGIRQNNARIVGGENALQNEFPWIGAIVFKGGSYQRKPFCGGSLVSDRYFISAAHCFVGERIKPDEINVVLHAHIMDRRTEGNPTDTRFTRIPGWNLAQETDESEESIRMEVQEIVTHPLFNDRTFDFDIAILKFKRAVNLKKGKVSPVCLPYKGESFSFMDGATMVVSGWGRPWEQAPAGARILQKLDVPFLNRKDCEQYTFPSNRHLCAGHIEGGQDACAGDSGGPLMYQFNRDDNQYLLSGIVSAGAGCARKGKMGLYSDVQELMQWAYHHMPDAVYCPRT